MEVTAVELRRSQKPGIVKAFGKATIDNELNLDVLIMDKSDGKGAWATFPNGRTGSDGKYYLPVFFKTKELDQAFKSKVLAEYNGMANAAAPAATAAPVNAGSENLPF